MPVAETSRWAFETVPLSERQQAVMAALLERGEATDQDLAMHLGWPINCVTPRRGELVEAGLVERSRVVKSPLTMRPVSVWRLVNRQLELFQGGR
jgi:DNA-binding MarR family transcriptional regulator